MSDLEKVREEGERSYITNKGVFLCPYADHTPELDYFERGWVQSRRRDPSPVKAVPSPAPWDYTKAAPPAPPDPYNAYADLKGRAEPRK